VRWWRSERGGWQDGGGMREERGEMITPALGFKG
jgi:hypothetical protein